jgi:hypothetical protein
MRLLLDANVLLDCLVLENTGLPRAGKAASDQVFDLCDQGIHQGLVAWHTLPIIAYYYSRQNSDADTAAMMESLLQVLQVPGVTHADAISWRQTGLIDFEDALQVVCAQAGQADIIITRNVSDFAGSPCPYMTPEQFLITYP